MHSEKTKKLLWALKQKEAAAIDARALEERQKELLEHKTKLHSLEVENAQLETALAQMQHAQTTALCDIHECEVVISRCREVEEVGYMMRFLSNLRHANHNLTSRPWCNVSKL
jgi:hypothetical protein